MPLGFTLYFTDQTINIENPTSNYHDSTTVLNLSENIGFSESITETVEIEVLLPADEHFLQFGDSVAPATVVNSGFQSHSFSFIFSEAILISNPYQSVWGAWRIQTRLDLSESVVFTDSTPSILDGPNHFIFNFSETLSLDFETERINYQHYRINLLTYYPTYDSFSRYSNINMEEGSLIRFGSAQTNKILFRTKENKLYVYPGTSYSVADPQFKTKDFYIEHGVIQKFLINYDNTTDPEMKMLGSSIVYATINTKSINSDNDEIGVDKRIISPGQNVWRGIGEGAGTGFKSNFLIRGARIAHSLILKYKTRLTGN